MLLSALLLPLLAPAATATAPREPPIFVTGNVWAPFISPMGEPFRSHSTSDDTLADWFRQADRNHDGILTPVEMQADADRYFAVLDTNHDGEIDPDELVHYEWQVAPEIQVMSKTRRARGEPAPKEKHRGGWQAGMGGDEDDPRSNHDWRRRDRQDGFQGAARYSLLNIPEPVAAADADFNRGISQGEFREAAATRFHLLDDQGAGVLTLMQLQALRASIAAAGKHPKRDEKAPDARVGNPLPTDR